MRRLCHLLLHLAALFAGQAAAQDIPDTAFLTAVRYAVDNADSFEDPVEAGVWLTDMSNRLKYIMTDPDERLFFLRQLHREAARVELEPELILAVIQVESNFDNFAISRVGARGLMQVMPFWIDEIGHPTDNLLNPKTNLRYGCTILKQYLVRENGNLSRALARYNGSLGKNDYPQKVFQALNNKWFKG